ncbi:MAG: hypothetical protein KA807_04620 [Prolixibacteraceae bacterium]|nr:hypothetical protein [Prolixibacteraceae bacterium]
MKRYNKSKTFNLMLLLAAIITAFASCDENDPMTDINLKSGLYIIVGDHYIFTTENIQYYDNSSHFFYLKNVPGENLNKFNNAKYWICSDGEVIYEGTFIGQSGEPCAGDSVLEYIKGRDADFVLKLGSMYSSTTFNPSIPDPRLEKKFTDELKRHGKFRYGLECKIDSMILSTPGMIKVFYNLKNQDDVNYYMLDPQKTPSDNKYTINWELTLTPQEPKVYNHPDMTETIYTFNTHPAPLYSNVTYKPGWDKEWLTLIRSGEKQSFSKDFYLLKDSIPSEEFWTHIMIPGLGDEFVEPQQIQLNDGQIWLGTLELLHLTMLQKNE